MCKRHVLAYDNQYLRVSSWDSFIPELVCGEGPRDFKNTDQLVHETIISRQEKSWGIRREGDIPQERSTLTWIQSPFGKYFILRCPMSTNISLPTRYVAYRVAAVEPNIETVLGKTEHHLLIWYFTSRETLKFSTVQWFLKQVQTTVLHEVFTWVLTFLL